MGGSGVLATPARAHQEIIRRFGRFPFRNEALGRPSTPEEQAFVDAGGYGPFFRAFAEAAQEQQQQQQQQ